MISCNYYIKLFQRNSWGITFRRERPGPKRGEAGHSKDDLVECCRGLLNHLRQKKPQTKYSCCLHFSFLMSDWLFPCKVLITFQMKYFCYKFMVFWVSWYYERQDLQDNILYIFIIFTLVQITRLWPWRRSGCKKKKEHHLPPSEKVTVMEDFFALIRPCTCKL